MKSSSGSLKEFLARYSPETARDFRKARTALRRRFPRGYELVYDNTQALGIGYSPTRRPSDIVVSVVAYPRWVTLFFFRARSLRDPGRLLQGAGRKIRSFRLQPITLLESEGVCDLLSQAALVAAVEMARAPKLGTVIQFKATRPRRRLPARSGASLR